MRGKFWLIDAVARRAGFTKKDTDILIQTFVEVIKESILEKKPVVVNGLFRVSVTTIEAHKGWSAADGCSIDIPESYRIVFKPSRKLAKQFKIPKAIKNKVDTFFYEDGDEELLFGNKSSDEEEEDF